MEPFARLGKRPDLRPIKKDEYILLPVSAKIPKQKFIGIADPMQEFFLAASGLMKTGIAHKIPFYRFFRGKK